MSCIQSSSNCMFLVFWSEIRQNRDSISAQFIHRPCCDALLKTHIVKNIMSCPVTKEQNMSGYFVSWRVFDHFKMYTNPMWSTKEKLNVNNIIYNSSTNYNLRVGDTWLLCPISNKNSVLGSIPAAGPQNEMCCCSSGVMLMHTFQTQQSSSSNNKHIY